MFYLFSLAVLLLSPLAGQLTFRLHPFLSLLHSHLSTHTSTDTFNPCRSQIFCRFTATAFSAYATADTSTHTVSRLTFQLLSGLNLQLLLALEALILQLHSVLTLKLTLQLLSTFPFAFRLPHQFQLCLSLTNIFKHFNCSLF